MRYTLVEKILAAGGPYKAVVDQYRVYEGDEDLPKVFPGENRMVAEGNDLHAFAEQIKKFMAEEGVEFQDVMGDMPGLQPGEVNLLFDEEGRVIELTLTGLSDQDLDTLVEEL